MYYKKIMSNVYLLPLFILSLVLNCKDTNTVKEPIKFSATNAYFEYYGRYERIENDVALISPGAYVSITFSGTYCEIYLKAEQEPYNYVSLELDGEYLGRRQIGSHDISALVLDVSENKKQHILKIFKESENFSGTVIFSGIKAENVFSNTSKSKGYIEFIGDSITCGAASDGSVISCDEGEYFDHENVYYSYGANVARVLELDFMLSSVSGIGMYRNWNDENVEEPIMPTVYENLYLDRNTTKKYGFKTIPDIVSICLGTNDLSKGDGVKPRLTFSKTTYVSNYINFVKTVYGYYPNVQIVLLNSPMIVGADNDVLVSCLKEVQTHFTNNKTKPIVLFEYNKAYTSGCLYHPSVKDHKEMAETLTSFFKGLL